VVSATIMRRSVAIELRADEVRQIPHGGQECLS
jgi:hypothetical protein